MGTWGPGSFENDDASDWLAELAFEDDTDFVEETLQDVADADGYIEAPECQQAIAAAEAVAALNGSPAREVPKEIADWADNLGEAPDEALVALAVRAVERVRNDSELKELWMEGDFMEWYEAMDDLLSRLAGTIEA